MVAKDRPVARPTSGLDIASTPLPERIGVQSVTLLSVMDVDFGRHIVHVHSLMESIVVAQGGEFDVTVEELTALFVTAIHSRVQHTRTKNGYPRQAPYIHPKNGWVIPTQFAYIANAVGFVRLPDGLEIVPEIDASALELVLSQEQWHALAVRLRGYESLGVRLVHALESREYGDEKIMIIIPVVSETGEVFYTSTDPSVGTHFLPAATLGIAARNMPVDVPLTWIPQYTVSARRLVAFFPRFAQTSEAG
jgi:hypothetical protein